MNVRWKIDESRLGKGARHDDRQTRLLATPGHPGARPLSGISSCTCYSKVQQIPVTQRPNDH